MPTVLFSISDAVIEQMCLLLMRFFYGIFSPIFVVYEFQDFSISTKPRSRLTIYVTNMGRI